MAWARSWVAVGVALALACAAVVGAASSASGKRSATPVAGTPFVLGTVPQKPLDSQEGRQIAAAGISSIRLYFDWSKAESKPGLYDWDKSDEAVREAAAAGLRAFPYLYATPEWATKVDRQECRPQECGGYPPQSPATRLAYARYAAAAVERYGPNGEFWEDHRGLPYRPITTWQIWNEPNLKAFFAPEVDPVAYAEIVKAASEEIHEEDPDAEVVIGGLSGTRTTSTRMSTAEWLTQFYAVPGIADSFDSLALHPYARNPAGVFDQLQTATAIAAVEDPGVPVWITELGWASAGDRVWAPVKTLRGQAKMVRRVFGRLIRNAATWNLRGAYWYAWRDTAPGDAVCGWCWAAGLLDAAGEPKPAYEALVRLTSL